MKHKTMGTTNMLTGVGYVWAFLSLISAMVSCAGFYLPFWLQGSMGNNTVTFGPFRRCNYPKFDSATEQILMVEECGYYTTYSDIPSFSWQLVTILVGVGCGLAILVSFTAVLSCCIQDIISQSLARFGGGIQLFAGLLIGGGCVLYPNGWDSSEVQQACGPAADAYNLGRCSLSWAYYLTIGGAASTILCACLSCHAAREKRGHYTM